MNLYDTKSRKLQAFTALQNDTIRIYSCGPTVYDHIHIGNLSSFIMADTLRRVIADAYPDRRVQHAMNFTDVDDKTIRRSRERHPDLPPQAALTRLTHEYTELFLQDFAAIGNDAAAMEFTSATAHIDGMQNLIRDLLAAGVAYIADDGVYFSIDAYRGRGRRYGQLLTITTDNTASERIQNDEYDKDSAHDFALWKLHKEHEPSWPFEVDGRTLDGRPGWHIECSVMSRALLGQPFDIHTGGVDLIFPHHENEIAQSTATGEDPVYASYFVHNEHLLIDGRKMSKSLQNFYTLSDITTRGFAPLDFRMLVLQSHYRSQSNFTFDNLTAARNRLQHFRQMADMRWQAHEQGALGAEHLQRAIRELRSALRDDLNTPLALAVISNIERSSTGGLQPAAVDDFMTFLTLIDATLGLNLSSGADLTDEFKTLIVQRDQAKAAKNFSAADAIRDQLTSAGIGLFDTPRGTVWYHSQSM